MEKRKFKNSYIKILLPLLGLLIFNTQTSFAQEKNKNNQTMEQELIKLSKNKWQWMTDRDIESLDNLFHEKSVFVHMGATFNKNEELDVIKNQEIIYKNTEIQDVSVRFIGNTAIVLDRIRLTAIVGGNEVINPFMVTEVYIQIDNQWKLASLSFTRLLGN